MGTGATIKILVNGNLTEEHTVVLYGDVDGDGVIGVIDLLKMKKHILNMRLLTGVELIAGNIDRSSDSSVDVLDLLQEKRHLLKISTINQY